MEKPEKQCVGKILVKFWLLNFQALPYTNFKC